MTTSESPWNPAEVALFLAASREEARTGAHGIPMRDATDPANQFRFKASSSPVTDFAQKSLNDAKRDYYKRWPAAEKDSGAHHWSVEPLD